MNFTSDWFAKSHEGSWGCWLEPLLAARGAVAVLEIGCYEGRSTCWLLEHVIAKHPESRLVCVDPWDATDQHGLAYERFTRNIAETGFAERVAVRRQPSNAVLWELPAQSFDFVYVDGDHTENGAAYDTEQALRLVKPDGIIAWDDVFFVNPEITPNVIAGIERGMLAAGVTKRCVVRVDACAVLFRGALP